MSLSYDRLIFLITLFWSTIKSDGPGYIPLSAEDLRRKKAEACKRRAAAKGFEFPERTYTNLTICASGTKN